MKSVEYNVTVEEMSNVLAYKPGTAFYAVGNPLMVTDLLSLVLKGEALLNKLSIKSFIFNGRQTITEIKDYIYLVKNVIGEIRFTYRQLKSEA